MTLMDFHQGFIYCESSNILHDKGFRFVEFLYFVSIFITLLNTKIIHSLIYVVGLEVLRRCPRSDLKLRHKWHNFFFIPTTRHFIRSIALILIFFLPYAQHQRCCHHEYLFGIYNEWVNPKIKNRDGNCCKIVYLWNTYSTTSQKI